MPVYRTIRNKLFDMFGAHKTKCHSANSHPTEVEQIMLFPMGVGGQAAVFLQLAAFAVAVLQTWSAAAGLAVESKLLQHQASKRAPHCPQIKLKPPPCLALHCF
jgi:hypothetical protein